MLSVFIGVIVVVIAVFEWLSHVTLPHAVAILTLIAGISIILGGLGDKYRTRL